MAQVNTMPFNRDAEMALLGCFLMDNDIVVELLEKMTEDDFYQESHKYIFTAMRKVFNERKPVDLVTVSDKLDGEGNLEKAGGIIYLTELAQITPSSANYQSYYDIVMRDSMHRKLIRFSKKVIEESMTSTDANKALAFAEKSIFDISKNTERSDLLSLSEGDVVDDVIRRFEILQADPNAFEGVWLATSPKTPSSQASTKTSPRPISARYPIWQATATSPLAYATWLPRPSR